MISRSIEQIAQMIDVANDISSFKNVLITGVCIDSRKVQPGNLFVPLKGEHVDGHQYVQKAIELGAKAAFWQEDVPNPPTEFPIIVVKDTMFALQELARSYRMQLDVKVVGITGSNGKTTTKDIMANLLATQFKVQKTEGNYNNHLGLPLTILNLQEDTEFAVLEMGMSGRGEIEFLTKLARPSAVIITNIGESHLLDLGSREAIAEAKLEIVQGVDDEGLIVYFKDEPLLQERMESYNGGAKVKTFGRHTNSDLYPLQINQLDKGSQFTINGCDQTFELPILGSHNVLNALAAMLVAHHFSIPYKGMNEGLATIKLTNMRMELVKGIKGESIINDAYNASPTSMRAAIDLVSQMGGFKKKIVVLGDMLELGPLEKEFHFKIGEQLASKNVDYVFTFGALGEEIAKGARTLLSEECVFSFTNKQELIQKLQSLTCGEELILVKASRGMKLEEVVTALQEKN